MKHTIRNQSTLSTVKSKFSQKQIKSEKYEKKIKTFFFKLSYYLLLKELMGRDDGNYLLSFLFPDLSIKCCGDHCSLGSNKPSFV